MCIRIEIPETALVVLIGASSAGKTTFAHSHFRDSEVLSSDRFRKMISDDENDQSVSAAAFELLYAAAARRLELMKLTVIDATSIQRRDRQKLLEIANEQNVHPAAIVLDPSIETLYERNSARSDRGAHGIPSSVIRKQHTELQHCVKKLRREGFRFVYVLKTPEEAETAEIVRTKLWNDKRDEHGPFDIIGDVHGCYRELREMLWKLGYVDSPDGVPFHPDGRKAAFVGDLCDRGPENVNVLKLVMAMVRSGNALAVPGNHDVKLAKYLRGRNVQVNHGLEVTVAELEKESTELRSDTADFLDALVSHYVLDDGKLVIAHAGIKEKYIGRGSARVREFCLYGDTTGEKDEYEFPVRLDWTEDYRGKAIVVYGHTPYTEVCKSGNTYCIDTGCVFGGKLTALRYPELETVSVPAHEKYAEPGRPMRQGSISEGDTLPAEDFRGDMHISTVLIPTVSVYENNTAAALEVMSRFAADPRWIIYLPPTMSPCETSRLEGWLEHPYEAFDYYRSHGVKEVVCEKKHMGSRAVVVLCRSSEAAKSRFGVDDGSRGMIYTRTGRRFFDSGNMETAILDRLCEVLTGTGFWEDFSTDWVCLDTELLPWSVKAMKLIREQYAPVGYAGHNALTAAEQLLKKACRRNNTAFQVDAVTSGQNTDLNALLDRVHARRDAVDRYIDAYSEYCRRVDSPDDVRVAPFHLLAAEGAVFSGRGHLWHMETLRKYVTGSDALFAETPFITVRTDDADSIESGVRWWTELTSCGGEGMVVKPADFVAINGTKLLQPAVKCRGREYLRIIYGPEYLQPDNLARLKKRSLTRKRTLALKEFSLGLEGLKRFVDREPLRRVHECAFGVLGLESEPVDPRL